MVVMVFGDGDGSVVSGDGSVGSNGDGSWGGSGGVGDSDVGSGGDGVWMVGVVVMDVGVMLGGGNDGGWVVVMVEL